MRKTRSLVVAMAVVGVACPALAHDFWLQPTHFNLAPGVVTPMTILVGHGPFRTRWSGAIDRVVLLQSRGPGGVEDLKPGLHPTPSKDADLRFATPGVYVVAFQSNYAESVLPSIRYNDYIKVEGLTPAIALRDRTHATAADGREIYSRRAKALIKVGQGSGADAAVTKPVGFSLEIVPEKDPYALAAGEQLPVRVFSDGKPLGGALVKLTNLEFDVRPIAMHRTDDQGRAAFTVPRTGTWLLNVIWTKPIKGNPKADFDTTFSSLTFGYGGYAAHN